MLLKSDYFYDLPEELIAQTPAEPRDSSRLLVYDRKTEKSGDRIFRDIKEYLRPGDVLVINNTKVLPARMYAYTKNGGRVEVLLLKRQNYTDWEVLVRPGKKAKEGTELVVSEELSLTVRSRTPTGERIVEFHFDGVFEDILSRVGSMPLPPYIHEKLKDKDRYQTVYCKTDGSAAAPTAGLHFTKELLAEIKAMGVQVAEVLLHVGLGTFRPVKEEDPDAPRHAFGILLRERGGRGHRQCGKAGGAARHRRGHDFCAHAGNGRGRKGDAAPVQRRHLHLYLSAVQIQVRGCAHHELSFARKYAHHARIRFYGQGAVPRAVQGSGGKKVSLFQLRGCDADRISKHNTGIYV